ncbi:MAG: hypothetical protein L0338_29460 [Acidobacteria bacterium]|nr:hypothetical protein [Acidobacteriota bacterium]
MADIIVGSALGLLIGVVSGTVALVLLKTVNTAKLKDVSSLVTLTSEMLAIPTFWFGGPWVSATLLKLVSLERIINPYIIAVAISFTLIVSYPVFRWIVHLGAELGRGGEEKNA